MSNPFLVLGMAGVVLGLLSLTLPKQMAWFIKAPLTPEAKVRFTIWTGRIQLVLGVGLLIAGFVLR